MKAEWNRHNRENISERVARLTKELGRKEKHFGEHAVIRAAIAKIERRSKRKW